MTINGGSAHISSPILIQKVSRTVLVFLDQVMLPVAKGTGHVTVGNPIKIILLEWNQEEFP
jgi:hypothetical protein